MSHCYAVYILASREKGTLDIGVTSDLERRIADHRRSAVPGFTEQYDVKRLVHYELFGDVHEAIAREKQLKKWNREWKLNLIERKNPQWIDLAAGWFGEIPPQAVIPAKAVTHSSVALAVVGSHHSGSLPSRG